MTASSDRVRRSLVKRGIVIGVLAALAMAALVAMLAAMVEPAQSRTVMTIAVAGLISVPAGVITADLLARRRARGRQDFGVFVPSAALLAAFVALLALAIWAGGR